MAALQASICLYGQLGIMVGGDVISCLCQIVILVYKTDIDPCGARLAVVAIHAGSANGICGETGDDGIILFLVRSIQEFQHLIQMLHGLHSRNCRENAGTVNGILQALGMGQSLPKGRMLCTQKLSCKEGLHDRNADALLGTPPEQIKAFLHRADAVLVTLLKIVGRVDGEHHHINQPRVNDPIGNGGRMGRKADMVYDPLCLQLLQIVQHTDLH